MIIIILEVTIRDGHELPVGQFVPVCFMAEQLFPGKYPLRGSIFASLSLLL